MINKMVRQFLRINSMKRLTRIADSTHSSTASLFSGFIFHLRPHFQYEKVPAIIFPSCLYQSQLRYCTTALEGKDEEKPTSESVEDPEAPRQPHRSDPIKEVSVETSMRYLKSEAYKQTYGDNKVWVLYRRNFKGQFAPKKTRKSCFFMGKLNSGNPCPICRDEYLILDYRNVDLLQQFISSHNGEILGTEKTGLCQEKHFYLLAEIEKAKDYGTLTFNYNFREYDYAEFYPQELLEKYNYKNSCNHE